MTPRFPLSGHLNLYLSIQNPAAFITILSTLHKHMTDHNTIPNTAIHIYLQANTFIVATLFLSFPPSNSNQLILAMVIPWWNSTICIEDQHITQKQLNGAHSPVDYFGISVYVFNGSLFHSNDIFFYDLGHYMVFSLGEFLTNIYSYIVRVITGL